MFKGSAAQGLATAVNAQLSKNSGKAEADALLDSANDVLGLWLDKQVGIHFSSPNSSLVRSLPPCKILAWLTRHRP